MSEARESLILTLSEALNTDKVVFWAPEEMDLSLEITPTLFPGWKDMESRIDVSHYSPKQEEGFRRIDEVRNDGGKYKEDLFGLEFRMPVTEFKDLSKRDQNDIVAGSVSFWIAVKRHQLDAFLSQLNVEYKDFCKKFKIYHSLGGIERVFKSVPKKKMSGLEKKFDQEMRKIHKKAIEQFGKKGHKMILLIEKYGGPKAAKLMLRRPENVSGATDLRFYQMTQKHGLNLTVEYLVAQPKWKKLFTSGEIKKARARLEKW
jgi:hypothetical protein